VFGFGGIEFAVPLLFFFISSSLLSKIRSPNKDKAADLNDKAGPRDIWQVIANGGIATLAALLSSIFERSLLLYVYLAAISEAAADTWATEIGTLSRRKTVSIVSFTQIESGTSGGISGYGTLAALAGSMMTVYSALIFMSLTGTDITINHGYFVLAWTCGFLGSMVDSVLGAAWQGQFKCATCNKITEKRAHCGCASIPYRGIVRVNNDVVNLMATGFAGLLMAAIIV
jgi:uncharacterized protein (TIGR00297 family)